MDFLNKEILTVLSFLLTGFVAQWVFHGLTAHPMRSDLDRIIHALILTTLIAPLSFGLREFLFWTGQHWRSFGRWQEWSPQATAVATAVVFGFVLAVCANNNWPHGWLNWQATRSQDGRTCLGRWSLRLFGSRFDGWLCRRWLVRKIASISITKKTTAPSEWFNTFNTEGDLRVILHLTGERRLYGYPVEFPDNPESGHFVIGEAEWLLDDNTRVPLYLTKRMLIPAKDVGWVEFEKPRGEVKATFEQLAEAERKLTKLHQQEADGDAAENGAVGSTGASGPGAGEAVQSERGSGGVEQPCAGGSPSGVSASPAAEIPPSVAARNGRPGSGSNKRNGRKKRRR